MVPNQPRAAKLALLNPKLLSVSKISTEAIHTICACWKLDIQILHRPWLSFDLTPLTLHL